MDRAQAGRTKVRFFIDSLLLSLGAIALLSIFQMVTNGSRERAETSVTEVQWNLSDLLVSPISIDVKLSDMGCQGQRREILQFDLNPYLGVADSNETLIPLAEPKAATAAMAKIVKRNACHSSLDLDSPLIHAEAKFNETCRNPEKGALFGDEVFVNQCLRSFLEYRFEVSDFLTRGIELEKLTAPALANKFFALSQRKQQSEEILDLAEQLFRVVPSKSMRVLLTQVYFLASSESKGEAVRARFEKLLVEGLFLDAHNADFLTMAFEDARLRGEWWKLEELGVETLRWTKHEDLAKFYLAAAAELRGRVERSRELLKQTIGNEEATVADLEARIALKGIEKGHSRPFRSLPFRIAYGFYSAEGRVLDPYQEAEKMEYPTYYVELSQPSQMEPEIFNGAMVEHLQAHLSRNKVQTVRNPF